MKFSRKQFFLSSLVFPLTIIAKIIQFNFLPSKYFYDSRHILAVMNGSNITDDSYTFTANFYNTINFLKLDNIYSWSIFLTIIFTIIIFIFLIKQKKAFTIPQYLFIFMNIFLLDLFAFNLSKEIIQLLFFFLAYIIINSEKIKKPWIKITLCALVFLIESLYFRTYYILLSILIVTIYSIYKNFIYNKNLDKKTFAKIITLSILLFFAEVFILQAISSENYSSLIDARYGVNIVRQNNIDAVTIINDPLGRNTNFLIFCGNYLINIARLVLPLELLFKGPKYLLFIIYQLMLLWILYKNCSNLTQKNLLPTIITISFIMVSAIFEPDFGSVIRHESCLFPFLLVLNISQEKEKTK